MKIFAWLDLGVEELFRFFSKLLKSDATNTPLRLVAHGGSCSARLTSNLLRESSSPSLIVLKIHTTVASEVFFGIIPSLLLRLFWFGPGSEQFMRRIQDW